MAMINNTALTAIKSSHNNIIDNGTVTLFMPNDGFACPAVIEDVDSVQQQVND